MEDKESRQLGHYRLMRRLARGGMSEVYLVTDERDEEIYALKMVRQRDEEDCQRFQQEVEVLMRLKHPHILSILDSGAQEGICYCVMPYIAHGTLKDRLEKGPLSEQEAEIVLTQVADALHFLHEAGFVHRDVKPSNILQDETNHVWLADFGLVRAIEGGSDLTRTGYLMGTPSYMAPELEEAQAGASSDLYALGVVLYEMLTGHVPFAGKTPLDIYWKQVYEQPPFPSTVNPLVLPAIEQVILQALEKQPSARYPSAQALVEAYQQARLTKNIASSTVGPIETRRTDILITPTQTIGGQRKGHVRRTPLAAGALVAMALLTLSLVSMGVVSQRGFSLLSNSPVQMPTVHAVGGSPTRTSPPAGTTTPGPVSSAPSGSASSPGTTAPLPGSTPPAGTSTSTPVPSTTAGSTPPAGTPTPTSVPSATPSPSATPGNTPTPSEKPKKKPPKG